MRLAAILTAIIVAVWAAQVVRARTARPRLSERERHEREQINEWRTEVLRRLGPAVRRLELARTPGKTGVAAIEGLDIQYPGRPIELGWEWSIQTPGVATMADLKSKESKLRSALNSPTPLVQALAVSPDARYEGHGKLRAYRQDPIHLVRPVNWKVGERVMARPTDPILAGVTRWGQEIRLPLYQTHWAVAGQNSSGKTSAVRVALDQLAPHVLDGTVRLHFVDVGKRGRGYKSYQSLFASWWVDPQEALDGVEALLATIRLRADGDGDRAVPITRATPMEVLIIEEAPAFLSVTRPKTKVTGNSLALAYSQQVRELGGVLIVVSQTMHHRVFDTNLRAQLRLRSGFRVATADESRMIIDGAGEGVDGPHTIPKTDGANGSVDWRGVSYVDPDGVGTELVRWYYVSEARAAAVGRLAAVKA